MVSSGGVGGRLQATNRLPRVQNAAIELSIEPRLFFGWNSAKYDHMTGPLPPNLRHARRVRN